MKRAFVFLVLAPVAVFLTVLLICLAVAGTKFFGFAAQCIVYPAATSG